MEPSHVEKLSDAIVAEVAHWADEQDGKGEINSTSVGGRYVIAVTKPKPDVGSKLAWITDDKLRHR